MLFVGEVCFVEFIIYFDVDLGVIDLVLEVVLGVLLVWIIDVSVGVVVDLWYFGLGGYDVVVVVY